MSCGSDDSGRDLAAAALPNANLAQTAQSSLSSSGRGSGDDNQSDILDSSSNGCGDDDQGAARKRRRVDDGGLSSAATTPPPAFESPPSQPPSHDVSSVPYHISSIENVAKQIQEAASQAWERRFQYKAVFALFLSWEEDDLNVAPEVTDLELTFRQVYHYKTECWKIGSRTPGWDTKERLLRFLRENDAEGNLVVLYYAGHAMPNPQTGGAPLWSSRRLHGKTMFSGSIMSIIEEAESDFLVLLDCCHGYHPPNRPSGTGRNIIEVISAVGFNGIAPEPGRDSFSHHLSEALALAKREGPIKVVDLHMRIIGRLLPRSPSRLRHGSYFAIDDRGPVEEKSPRQCPLHYWMSGRPKSITLAPLKPMPVTAEGSQALCQLSSTKEPTSENQSTGDSTSSGIIGIRRTDADPQVLVCFRVTKGEFDARTWVKWLLEAPLEAQDLIKIEGFYGSFSSLVLVRMPVPVWNVLPESSAVSFVGFTTTDNSGAKFQKQVDALLSAQRGNDDLEHHYGEGGIESTACVSNATQDIRRRRSLSGQVWGDISSESGNILSRRGNNSSEISCDKLPENAVISELMSHSDKSVRGVDGNRYACPFYKHNPGNCEKRSCRGPGWLNVHRVKQHIYRCHLMPNHFCPRCYEEFSTAKALTVHCSKDVPCQAAGIPLRKGLDQAEEGLLRIRATRKGKSKSEAEKWRDVYKIIYPEVPDDVIPSPYYDASGPRELHGAAHCLRIRKELEYALEPLLHLVQEGFKEDAIDRIRHLATYLVVTYRLHDTDAAPSPPPAVYKPPSAVYKSPSAFYKSPSAVYKPGTPDIASQFYWWQDHPTERVRLGPWDVDGDSDEERNLAGERSLLRDLTE